jgi:ATP-dependent RNA helicase SUPV3L1/SUV3
LNIGRIIFHTTIKAGQNHGGLLEPTNVKQIAGRAGRMSSNYKIGEVTSWQEADLAYIKAVMKWEIPQIQSAGIFPTVDQIESFSDQLQNAALASVADANECEENDNKEATLDIIKAESFQLSFILDKFVQLSNIDSRYFLCDYESINTISNWLHSIPLTMADRFIFSNAPVNIREPLAMKYIYQFASSYALNRFTFIII